MNTYDTIGEILAENKEAVIIIDVQKKIYPHEQPYYNKRRDVNYQLSAALKYFMTKNEFNSVINDYIGINNAPFEEIGFLTDYGSGEIKKIGFVLDLCKETIRKAILENCDVLFCFHAKKSRVTLFKEDLQKGKLDVYVCHLPLNFASNGIHKNMIELFGLTGEPHFLQKDGDEIIGGLYAIHESKLLDELITHIRKVVKDTIKVYNPFEKEYKKIVFSSGSGCKDEIFDQIDCDCIITGELKHGSIIKAQDKDITLIEIGHYESEAPALKKICEQIGGNLENVEVIFIENKPKMLLK